MTVFGESFDDRSEGELRRVVFWAMLRHLVPAFVVPMLGVVVAAVSWPLAVVGALNLPSPWMLPALGVLAVPPTQLVWALIRVPARRRAEQAKGPVRRRQAREVVVRAAAGWWPTFRPQMPYWLLLTVPKALLAGWAVQMWWPTSAGVAVYTVVAGMPLVLVAYDLRSVRVTQVARMFVDEEEGEEGPPPRV
jgi:hypothetical protein